MITPNELRKKVGCWSCVNAEIHRTDADATISCNSTDPDVQKDFTGWNSALTCKGYKMRPYTVSLHKGKGGTDNG